MIFRDGVGDGQIPYVKEHEVEMIKRVFKENEFEPKFTFIIVSKRINSRFFKLSNANGPPVNPPSGSVIDDVVVITLIFFLLAICFCAVVHTFKFILQTLPERYDFFLISQSVRQGTVNPTSYNVIEDTSGWSPNIVQQLSYKMTHLYYNWPGTVS